MKRESRSGAVSDRDGNRGRLAESLVDDAVALGEADEGGELIGRGVGIEIEGEADIAEADGGVFGDAEGAAEIEVAFGADGAAAEFDAERSGDGGERDARAGGEGFEQHVAGAGEGAGAAGGGMEAGFDECFAGLDAARDAFADAAGGSKRDDGGLGIGAVAVFERGLGSAEVVAGHRLIMANEREGTGAVSDTPGRIIRSHLWP